jgi:mono/diheme cytochrome c family protein
MRTMLLVAIAAALLCGCRGNDPAPTTNAVDGAASQAVPVADGRTIAASNCRSCHSDEMLRQQRLTATQWASVVKKMTTWGAPLDPAETAPLVAYLASTYGTDAGPYAPATISASVAAGEIAPRDDGSFANGDVERGRSLFAGRCAACHGPGARGQLGVNLVDRPILYRAIDVAQTVRRGRGKMTPLPATTDPELADLLAYLRALHS